MLTDLQWQAAISDLGDMISGCRGCIDCQRFLA